MGRSRKCLSVNKETGQKLEAVSRLTGLSMAQVVKDAIDLLLEKRELESTVGLAAFVLDDMGRLAKIDLETAVVMVKAWLYKNGLVTNEVVMTPEFTKAVMYALMAKKRGGAEITAEDIARVVVYLAHYLK